MRLILRIAAWWITVVGGSLLVLTLAYPELVESSGCMGPLLVVRSVGDEEHAGAWLLLAVALAGATELWRARTLGLVLGGGFLSWLAVAGGSKAWADGAAMALATSGIHAAFAAAILQPAAWRECRERQMENGREPAGK